LFKRAFSLKFYVPIVVRYRFKFPDERRATAFVRVLTGTCANLCVYRSLLEVTVLDGSAMGQREEIYSAAWIHGAKVS
jgi:hypothetical protein